MLLVAFNMSKKRSKAVDSLTISSLFTISIRQCCSCSMVLQTRLSRQCNNREYNNSKGYSKSTNLSKIIWCLEGSAICKVSRVSHLNFSRSISFATSPCCSYYTEILQKSILGLLADNLPKKEVVPQKYSKAPSKASGKRFQQRADKTPRYTKIKHKSSWIQHSWKAGTFTLDPSRGTPKNGHHT